MGEEIGTRASGSDGRKPRLVPYDLPDELVSTVEGPVSGSGQKWFFAFRFTVPDAISRSTAPMPSSALEVGVGRDAAAADRAVQTPSSNSELVSEFGHLAVPTNKRDDAMAEPLKKHDVRPTS